MNFFKKFGFKKSKDMQFYKHSKVKSSDIYSAGKYNSYYFHVYTVLLEDEIIYRDIDIQIPFLTYMLRNPIINPINEDKNSYYVNRVSICISLIPSMNIQLKFIKL